MGTKKCWCYKGLQIAPSQGSYTPGSEGKSSLGCFTLQAAILVIYEFWKKTQKKNDLSQTNVTNGGGGGGYGANKEQEELRK